MVLALHLTSSFPFSFLKLHPIIYLNIVTYTQFKYNSQLTHLIILVAYTTSTLLKIHMCLISSAHFSSSAPPSLKLNNEAIRAVLLSYYCFNFTISDKNQSLNFDDWYFFKSCRLLISLLSLCSFLYKIELLSYYFSDKIQ